MDNADAFAVALPLTFDGLTIIPWGLYGSIGPNAVRSLYNPTSGTSAGQLFAGNGNIPRSGALLNGLLPAEVWTSKVPDRIMKKLKGSYSTLYYGGLTGKVTATDPLSIGWDFNYGSNKWEGLSELDRTGWVLNLVVEYKMDWGVPGIIGWYGSGDDNNPKNGSERLPVLDINDVNYGASNFGFNGSPQVASPEAVLGQDFYAGSWGLGLRVRDMSFVEKLKHTFRVNFFGGNNDPAMAKYILGKKSKPGAYSLAIGRVTDFNSSLGTSGSGMYLTSQDYGVELNLDTSYKIYDNLEMIVELGYIHLMLDQSKSVWGSSQPHGVSGVNLVDAMKASVFFKYSF